MHPPTLCATRWTPAKGDGAILTAYRLLCTHVSISVDLFEFSLKLVSTPEQ